MTNNSCNFEVERVALNDLGIDAGQKLGMVIVQPDYELVPDGTVPFRISKNYREPQKSLIEKAFQIRSIESQERNVPIPFIVFPEASIPVCSLDVLDYIRQQMEQALGELIFIGGLEGLSPQKAGEVVNRFAVTTRPVFTAGTFVNLCVIVVKSSNGQLSWHFQAKLRPSQLEQQRNMALGHRILHFVAPRVAFLCQICFDHTAADGEEILNITMCRQLIDKARPNAATLDFVFVPQYNPMPQAPIVRQNRSRLLNYTDRALNTSMTTVIVVNKAAETQESSEYGRSGFHYKAGRWQISTTDVGPKGYELYGPEDVTSAIFRKRTQSIHVATLVPPSYNVGSSGNPRKPLENPRSFLIGDGCDATQCSCLPGTTLPIGTFVECDCLPCKLRDTAITMLPAKDGNGRWQCSDASQNQLLERHYEKIREDLLILGASRTRELVDLLLSMHSTDNCNPNNPDLWTPPQFEAVVEFLSSMSVLAELQMVDFNTMSQWTATVGDSFSVILIDGLNQKSWQEMEFSYKKKFEGYYYNPDSRIKPVLFVALKSRGQVQPPVNPGWFDFTTPQDQNRLSEKDSFTKPFQLRFYTCQGGIFDEARRATIIKEFLKNELRCCLG